MKRLALLFFAVALSLLVVSTASSEEISVVANFDAAAGELPEGLAVDAAGNAYVGMAPTGEIRRVTPSGEVSTFANLPSPGADGFMVGMEFDAEGRLYVLLASFDPATHGVWRISADGASQELLVSLDVEGLPNALAFDSLGNFYVSETIGGQIWKIDAQGGVSVWFSDELLHGGEPGPFGFPLGANGIALDAEEEYLYIANTGFGRIVRVSVNDDGSAGTADVFAEDADLLGGADGIAFGDQGNLYVAVIAQDRIAVVSSDGTASSLAQGDPFNNPASIAFGTGEYAEDLYITNFSVLRAQGIVPGDPMPGLLRLHIGERGILHEVEDSPVGLPSTGSGGADAVNAGWWWALAGLGALVALASAIGLAYRRNA